ncbi:MAG TPA: DUF763 domain-containing protein [Pyrinomonadaceae bacterium]|nr:DUF763 domain-containing protein [Pyrinomonadaceae bacterium]
MKRSGFADLPLHGGRVPLWLAERMTKLGTAITETVVHHYGTSTALRVASAIRRVSRSRMGAKMVIRFRCR